MKRLRIFVLSIFAFCPISAMFVSSAGAAVLDVCQTGGATYTSIQDAVYDASNGDVIDVCAGAHTEAGISISDLDLVIQGQGQGLTIVQAAADETSATDRVFFVAGASVTFRDLTIRYGRAPGRGGGIYCEDAWVNVERCTVTKNHARGNGGGLGFLSTGWTHLTVVDSRLADNEAGLVGGGIGGSDGTILIERTTVNGNVAGGGGGIDLDFGILSIVGSTLSGNTASTWSGGGILVNGELLLANSTVSGNTAVSVGSGAHFIGLSYSAYPNAIVNSTLAGNAGGGAALYLDDDSMRGIGNTIVAGNVGGDCAVGGGSALVAIGPNLDSDGSCPGFSHPSGNADLQPLADNGGPTPTRAITAASDAFDAGDDTLCAEATYKISGIDQRGVIRPQHAHCDLGAFELDEPNQPPDCSGAFASPELLMLPTNNYKSIAIDGVFDPDADPVSLVVDAIFQDEVVTVPPTCPDAQGLGTSTPQVRAERAYSGDGRVYHIFFTASSLGGTCSSEVRVGVPHRMKGDLLIDGGALFDSTACP